MQTPVPINKKIISVSTALTIKTCKVEFVVIKFNLSKSRISDTLTLGIKSILIPEGSMVGYFAKQLQILALSD